MEPLDKLGRRIEVGSYVVYGHTKQSSGLLRIGKILKIVKKDKDHHGRQKWSFQVIGIDDDYEGFFGVRLNEKQGTLSYRDRIVVLDPEQLPTEYFQLLKDF